MTYVKALVYDSEGNFRGYTTLNHEANKLKSTNLWSEEEQPKLDEQLDRLNVDTQLKATWPRTDDPDVIALLQNRSWMPYQTKLAKVVDDAQSHYVYHQEPEVDALGNPTGRMTKGHLDEEASVIRFKMAEVPVNPIDVQIRTKRAQEIVARHRAGLPA
jgi:hypothetical protein